MVDSAVRKKPSKARGTYRVYSDEDRFSIGKMQAFTVPPLHDGKRWKKIYPHINESTVH